MGRGGRWVVGAGAALGLVAWVAVPATIITAATAVDADADIARAEQTWVPVRDNDAPTVVNAEIDLTWEASPAVVAPAWTGTVTSVAEAAGGSLASGAEVARVNGVARLAVYTEGPFWRVLALGDTGRDVQWLNAYLSGAGLPAGGGATVTERTVTGIQRLSVSLGFPRATPASAFDPSWFIYLPQEQVAVGASVLVVGAPAPAAGEVLATPVTLLSGGTLAVSGTTPVDPAAAGIGEQAGGAATADATTSAGGGTDGAQGVPTSAAATQEVLLGATPLELETDRSTMTRAALDLVSTQVDDGTPVAAVQLSSPPGPDEFLVPPAAVFTAAGGATCVRARTAGGAAAPVPVVVVSGATSGSVVTGALEPGMSVEVGTRPGDRTCTS